MNSIALYGNTFKLRLTLKSIEEEFKVLRGELLQFSKVTSPLKSQGQGQQSNPAGNGGRRLPLSRQSHGYAMES